MEQSLVTSAPTGSSELLLLSDGTIFVHNLTPGLAELLVRINPFDTEMKMRASRAQNLPDACRARGGLR